jgi:hypothetical protein
MNQISVDVWRTILSFIDTVDIPSVSCIQYFKENVFEHQSFWINRFKKDYPKDLHKIIQTNVNSRIKRYKTWKEIRREYIAQWTAKVYHYKKVDVNKIDVVDIRPIKKNIDVGKIRYENGKRLMIQTPNVSFPFRMKNGYIHASIDDRQELFIKLLRDIDDHVMKKFHLPKELFYNTVRETKKINVKITSITECYDTNMTLINIMDIPRGSKGIMIIRYSDYLDYKSQYFNRFIIHVIKIKLTGVLYNDPLYDAFIFE